MIDDGKRKRLIDLQRAGREEYTHPGCLKLGSGRCVERSVGIEASWMGIQ